MDKLDKLREVKSKIQLAGLDEKVCMQHKLNKMTAKERIVSLVDEGSFIELGALRNNTGSGVITGYGTVQGKLIYVYSQDYTVNGGALNKVGADKICKLMDMALKMGAPLVQILDSVGGTVQEGLDILASYGKIIKMNSIISGVVPQISVIAGPCLGISALGATISDFTIMVNGEGSLGVNSKEKLIKKEEKYISEEMYSTSKQCSENGSVQIYVDSDREALVIAKEIIEYLPSNNLEFSPMSEEDPYLNEEIDSLNEMVRDDSIDNKNIIKEIADNNKIFEINKELSKNSLTAFIKINGMTIGAMANLNEKVIDIKVIEKLCRFIKLCDSFNIPILSIVDTKGFVIDLEEEKQGLSLYGGKLIYSLGSASVPKLSLVVGEAYGSSYIVLASNESAFDATLAWPSAKIAIADPRDLAKDMYKEEIFSSSKPKTEEDSIIEKHLEEITDIYKAAEKGIVDDIIMPSETKQRVFSAFDMLRSKRELQYPKKHGSTLV